MRKWKHPNLGPFTAGYINLPASVLKNALILLIPLAELSPFLEFAHWILFCSLPTHYSWNYLLSSVLLSLLEKHAIQTFNNISRFKKQNKTKQKPSLTHVPFKRLFPYHLLRQNFSKEWSKLLASVSSPLFAAPQRPLFDKVVSNHHVAKSSDQFPVFLLLNLSVIFLFQVFFTCFLGGTTLWIFLLSYLLLLLGLLCWIFLLCLTQWC